MRAYVPFYLAFNYALFAFAAALGALQVSAATNRRLAISVLPGQSRARLGLAYAWIIGAHILFWFCAPELLTPGPAGAELAALFGASALLAIAVTRLMARATSDAQQPTTDNHQLTGHVSRLTPHVLRFTFYVLLSTIISLYDLPLFRLLNSLAGHSPALDAVIQFLMNDYIAPTALALTLLGLWFTGSSPAERAAHQSAILRALLAFIIASVILKFINNVYFRPRPFTSYDVTLLFYHPSDSSLPSNAATLGFSLAVAIWLRHRPCGAWMLALAGALSLARVCGGVHFPLDIVAGAWLGGLSAWAVNRAAWLDGPIERVIRLAQWMTLA